MEIQEAVIFKKKIFASFFLFCFIIFTFVYILLQLVQLFAHNR